MELELDQLAVARARGIRIRWKVRADFEDDYRWRTDPETARLDGNAVLALPFDAYAKLVEKELMFGDPNRMSYSIDLDGEGHAGNMMLYNFGPARESAEFGISFGLESARGRGLGPAAMVAFLRYAWANLPFRTIFLHTFEWNDRARKAFERAGFSEAALIQRGDDLLIRMEATREWWLLWDSEGRFEGALERGRAAGQPANG